MDRNAVVLPGGMTSTNRKVDRPLVFTAARGADVVDADGRTYVDYNCAFGATLLGHCQPAIAKAVFDTMNGGIDLIGLSATSLEGELAARIVASVPSAEQAMFVNSGSEATFHALRLARAVTGRQQIVKFQGSYHGWHDYVAMNVATPRDAIGSKHLLSAGVLPAASNATTVARFNDVEALDQLLRRSGHDIAAIIIEPIQHNIGSVVATATFLQALRQKTREHGVVLIFDEVVTGFRHGLGGYQEICGITPDLTTLGKAMANGMPIAALVGKRELMERCAPPPTGDVMIAGTYNGAPACVAAALKTMDLLDAAAYDHLYRLGETMRSGLQDIFDRLSVPAQAAGFGSVWLPYFFSGDFLRYEDLLANDDSMDRAFRAGMIDRGFLTTPTPLKRYNFSVAHNAEHVARTLEAAEDVVRALRGAPSREIVT
jgi:glutamate-1-semialdehyde 2,1-aminomutase